MIIKVGTVVITDPGVAQSFGRAIGELVSQGHHVAIVHGSIRRPNMASPVSSGNAVMHSGSVNGSQGNLPVSDCEHFNKSLVSLLAQAGNASFGLFPSDSRMIRARRRNNHMKLPAVEFEAATVDPFWLEVISGHGGIPVVASMIRDLDRCYHCIDSDHMAAACASVWNADALIFLTRTDGIKNSDGAVIKWLEMRNVDDLVRSNQLTESMLSKLLACREALMHGVRRARLLPVSQIDGLPAFYFSRIDGGTEVICTDPPNYRCPETTPCTVVAPSDGYVKLKE